MDYDNFFAGRVDALKAEGREEKNAALEELKEFCGGEKEIQVFRELTKKYEEQIGNNINEVINYFLDKEVLGEITVVIKGRNMAEEDQEFDELELKKELLAKNQLIEAKNQELNELKIKNRQLHQENQETQERQKLMDEELRKAEAQIEFIMELMNEDKEQNQ